MAGFHAHFDSLVRRLPAAGVIGRRGGGDDDAPAQVWALPAGGGEASVLTQLVVYPGEHHGLKVPSYLQDRLERLIDWNARHLMPERGDE
jgi:hypothetical protein